MSHDQHDRLTELFEQAVELPSHARGAFIDASTDDLTVRSELESLLAVHDRTPNRLERLAVEVVPALLDAVVPDDAVSVAQRTRPSRSRQADLVGATLAHYRVVSHLGSGGMGDVYVARDTVLDRSVALKVLPPEDAVTQHGMRRFIEEAKAASALNHPNIATIHELREADGVHFIVMEYVEGATLKSQITHGPAQFIGTNQTRNPDGAGPGRGTQRRHHPPRHQVVQHHGYAARTRQGAGLRSGHANDWKRRLWRGSGRSDGNGAVHVSGTGARRGARSSVGSFQSRRGAVRNGDGAPAILRARRKRHDRQHREWSSRSRSPPSTRISLWRWRRSSSAVSRSESSVECRPQRSSRHSCKARRDARIRAAPVTS